VAGPALPNLPGVRGGAVCNTVRARGIRAAQCPSAAGRGELLLADAVFAELDRLDAVGAVVPFGGRFGRAGAGGQVGSMRCRT